MMTKEELLLKKCVRGMKTLIDSSKPKSKSAFKISVEIPSDDEEKMDVDEEPIQENTWLYFNNLFKETRLPNREFPEIIQPTVLKQTFGALCGFHTYFNLRC